MTARLRILSGLLLLLLLLASFAVVRFFQANKTEQAAHVARQNLAALDVAYRSTISMYRLDAETLFSERIQRRDVLELLGAANRADADTLPVIRGRLYRTLLPTYRDMQTKGLRQLHFHFPDGRSLLRFHSPEHLGDPSLFAIRPTIRIANTELRPAVGFEGGRILPGFRYVFPILSEGRHLGSVELSLPFERIQQNLIELLQPGDYGLLLHRDTVAKVFEDLKGQFVVSALHADYFKENPLISQASRAFVESERSRRLDALLRDDARVRAGMAAGSSFSVPIWLDGRGYIAAFHTIRDLSGAHAAYVVGYAEAPVLVGLRDTAWLQGAFVLALVLGLALLLWALLRSRQRLAGERARLETITEQIADGLCVLDPRGAVVRINRAALEMTGYAREEALGRAARDLLLPAEALGAAAPAALPEQGESVFARKDGSGFPVEIGSRSLVEGERTTGAVMLFRDISARKAEENAARLAREAIERLSARNALLLDSAGEGIYGVDPEGRCLFINPAALNMLGFRAEEVLGQDQHALFHHHHADGSAYPHAECPIHQTLHDGQTREVEDAFICRDGRLVDVRLTVTPMRAGDRGEGAVVVFHDITEHKRMQRELCRLATTDPLTGIDNRRRFMEQLNQELARVRRYGHAAALLMFDLDHFKRVNDRHGHAAGDAVLRHFTGLCNGLLREVDQFGRLGGEEFAVLLPDTPLAGAREFAERLRQTVADTPCDVGMAVVSYTVSIGIAGCDQGAVDADSVLARADRALYRAKSEGRNRSVIDVDEAGAAHA